MLPKPDFLTPEAAAAFQHPGVARAYRYRPTYAAAVFDILAGLVVDQPRHVLDVGCGTGLLARHFVERVERVDAVDVSEEMIEQGKLLPQGDHPNLTWILGRAEDAPLHPPYSLITAGDSLHWMDWEVVMPRFARMLTPRGKLAVLGADQLPPPWQDALLPVIQRYSVMSNWQPYDLIKELEERSLFRRVGSQRTEPTPFVQTVDEYIASFHARASLAWGRMTADAAAAFDSEVRALVSRFSPEQVELQLVTEVVWGIPLDPGETV
ncbi:MAG TPA: class I SAM-dependent methyltransferase [Ktedonobacterales bacterium]